MIRGNLPPQAYTREVVAHAYNWLQSQPEHIRRLAQNTDTLVALYLRAKRNPDMPPTNEGDSAASVESFRNQLKNLATEIQQFVPEQEKYTAPAPQPQEPTFAYNQAPVRATFAPNDLSFLDPQSLEILKKVRQHLNLGSETEAMRMLLVLGYEKIQGLFKGTP